MEQSILWYDLETFGVNPFHDRIAQFAALRTNFRFEPIEEPILLYCYPADDYLPNPEACLVTGITPLECMEKGMPEYDFARKIFDAMTVPGSTVAGYNSIQFDDEFIRNLFYRNLFDPYIREYANGNSRWDIINLTRACRDLRPGSINWPLNDDGKPVFKLAALAAANNIGHERAHDALSDVHATIGLARRIRKEQTRLFDWALSNRSKESLRKLFDLNTRPALVYSSAQLTREEGCSTLICPLGTPGENSQQGRNTVLCADLRYDPSGILDLSVEEIRQRIFLPAVMEDENHTRFPIHNIKINRAPFIAPLNTLKALEAKKLGIDIDQCLKHRELLLKHKSLSAKIMEVFNDPPKSTLPNDPDYQLYGSFINDKDRRSFAAIHEQLGTILLTKSEQRENHVRQLISDIQEIQFVEQDRISKLLSRLVGRSFGGYLGGKVADSWRAFCQNRLIFPLLDEAMDIQQFQKRIKALQAGADLNQKLILKNLLVYFDELKSRVLSNP